MPEFTVVHANVFDPSKSFLFKPKKTDRAECQTIECCLPECPLLSAGTCHMRGGLFGQPCPYGKSRREQGPTMRAAGMRDWVRERKEKYKGVPFLDVPKDKITFIGEYVLLPYPHMTMIESVPFTSRAGVFANGNPFLPRDLWTIDVVLALIDGRPRTVFGGDITRYQAEVVPAFLTHLREVDQAMWLQVLAARPSLDKPANHVGRIAVLSTLKCPLDWTESGNNYPVTWHWDGTVLTTTSMNSYAATWGRVKIASVVIKATPEVNATVVVQSNDWVTPDTNFLN